MAVLKASLDQALIVLGEHQKESQTGMGQRDVRITELEAKHRELLYQMMDNVLQTCINTVTDGIFHFEAPNEVGPKASPEHLLTLIEKAQQNCNEFSNSFVKLINVHSINDRVVIPKMP